MLSNKLTKNEKTLLDLLDTTMHMLNEQERRSNGITKKTIKEFEGLVKAISKELDADHKKVLDAYYN